MKVAMEILEVGVEQIAREEVIMKVAMEMLEMEVIRKAMEIGEVWVHMGTKEDIMGVKEEGTIKVIKITVESGETITTKEGQMTAMVEEVAIPVIKLEKKLKDVLRIVGGVTKDTLGVVRGVIIRADICPHLIRG